MTDVPSLGGELIDACAFHDWASPGALAPYMSDGWSQLVARPGDLPAPMSVKSVWRHDDPRGAKDPAAYPPAGIPGSDREFLAGQLFAGETRSRVVLGYHEALLTAAFPQPSLARQMVSAANDWTVEEWLSRDERLFGYVLIVAAQPEAAAAEIRRIGAHERIVGVALGANGLGHHFGHPVYAPVHEAAAELNLPLMIQIGSDNSTDVPSVAVGAGFPGTFGEYLIHSGQPLMAHAVSMILEGVFDRHPNLRVYLVGGGASWVPWCLWNLDYMFRQTRRFETPWLTMLPSEYFTQFVRVSTYALETPADPSRLELVLSTIPDVEKMLIYASGYPMRDWEQPDTIATRLPESWHRRVFADNAKELFRWPADVRAERPMTPTGAATDRTSR